ncbi:MAG: LCP family protein [Nitriliruptoraceae bacterium]
MGRQRAQTAPQVEAEQGWGPEVDRRGGRRMLRRVLVIVLVLVLVVAVGVPLLAAGRLARIPVQGLASGGSPRHMLIIGSDSREGLTRQEQRELSTGSQDVFTGERTDTIILLTFDRGRAAMLSFPRDLWVERCDGSSGRINVATSIGGPECLVDTVAGVAGIQAHHVARVTFGGFRELVDAVGGVELCLEDAITDRDAGIDLPAGCQVLDGADALGYVRVRKIDNDLERIRRQQRFVQALARELTEPAVLLNPLAVWELSGQAGQAVQVDEQLGVIDLARVGWAGRAVAAGEVATFTVPVVPRTTSGGAAVLELQQPEAEAVFQRFRDGRILVETGGEDAPELSREEIRVDIANGTGIAGLAGATADELAALGFEIGEVTNAPPTVVTLVRYPPGQDRAARLVAADVPGPTALEEAPDLEHIAVILSEDATR